MSTIEIRKELAEIANDGLGRINSLCGEIDYMMSSLVEHKAARKMTFNQLGKYRSKIGQIEQCSTVISQQSRNIRQNLQEIMRMLTAMDQESGGDK